MSSSCFHYRSPFSSARLTSPPVSCLNTAFHTKLLFWFMCVVFFCFKFFLIVFIFSKYSLWWLLLLVYHPAKRPNLNAKPSLSLCACFFFRCFDHLLGRAMMVYSSTSSRSFLFGLFLSLAIIIITIYASSGCCCCYCCSFFVQMHIVQFLFILPS
jgi:hypothetical protein